MLQRRRSSRHGSISGVAVADDAATLHTWLEDHVIGDILTARAGPDRGGAPHAVGPDDAMAEVLGRFRTHGVHNLLLQDAGLHWVCQRDMVSAAVAAEADVSAAPLGALLRDGRVHIRRAHEPCTADTPIARVLAEWVAAARSRRPACAAGCSAHVYGAHHWLPPLLVRPAATRSADVAALRVVTVADVLRYMMLHEAKLGAVLDAPVAVLGGLRPGDAHLVGAGDSAARALGMLLSPANPTDVLGVVDGVALVGAFTLHTATSLLLSSMTVGRAAVGMGGDAPAARPSDRAEGLPVAAQNGDASGDEPSDSEASGSDGEGAQTQSLVTPMLPALQSTERLPVRAVLASPRAAAGRSGGALAGAPATVAGTVCTVKTVLARILRARTHCVWVVDDFGRPSSLILMSHLVAYLHDLCAPR